MTIVIIATYLFIGCVYGIFAHKRLMKKLEEHYQQSTDIDKDIMDFWDFRGLLPQIVNVLLWPNALYKRIKRLIL